MVFARAKHSRREVAPSDARAGYVAEGFVQHSSMGLSGFDGGAQHGRISIVSGVVGVVAASIRD